MEEIRGYYSNSTLLKQFLLCKFNYHRPPVDVFQKALINRLVYLDDTLNYSFGK